MPKSNEIYLDNASATPIDTRVFNTMAKVLKEDFSNASAIHALGVKIKNKLEEARADIAYILGAHNDEIIFTSGATESNNLAILGMAKGHIIITNIEHVSILEAVKYRGAVTFVEVEKNGIVSPDKIKKALQPDTILVSVMYANNEIGTIQPIREIAKIIRHWNKIMNKKVFFHTDATQAINYLPVKVEKLGVDLLSFNAGKIYGPKGVGVLFVKRKTPISKILFGGEQEFNLRAGTENVASIVGLAEALKIAEKIKEKESARLIELRDYFIASLSRLNLDSRLNGDKEKRLPNNVNITISKIPSDLLVLELSAKGIYVSEKSACKSGDKADSYVIRAIRNNKICKKEGSLRFSLGRQTTKEDLVYTVKTLTQILKKLEKWYSR